MQAVLQTIRILVITLLIKHARCQDGYSNKDYMQHLQHLANEGPIETINSYNSNTLLRDPNSQSVSSVNVQFTIKDHQDNIEEFNRADRARSRKVFRIKNPFHVENHDREQDSNAEAQDSDTGASNQYASMQYSLPPEEFLQQIRRESQFYQQQQQVSTQAPNLGYTATPQPQYQYSTIAASGYDNSQQSSPQNEAKEINPQTYRSLVNSHPYIAPNSYGVESIQSTPSPVPPYLSTSFPNNQYGTQANTYVSSSSPIYLSSPPNLQQYISSSTSSNQAGTPDYNNKVTSTLVSNTLSFENYDPSKNIQIDHYDNSAHGVRYPTDVNQQYHNDYPSSTPAPSSSPYPDHMRDYNSNNNINSVSKSLQELSLSHYPYNRNTQESRTDLNPESSNNEIHRISSIPSANNVYLNFVQPDFQALANLRSRNRDVEQETAQQEYTHGEYGWKVNDRKPYIGHSPNYTPLNFQRYQTFNSQPDGVAVSQMSFHMDTGKPNNYNQISKSSSDNAEAQEFAKAAAKAHDNLKRQQVYENNYGVNFNTNNQYSSLLAGNSYYNTNDKQKNKIYTDGTNANPYQYNNSPQDLITVSPHYYINSKENPLDNKPKQQFDHDRALKNIVPIDVSNVVSNSENQHKSNLGSDENNRYSNSNFKEQMEQNFRQDYKAIADSYYQDKNAVYGLNIKTKPREPVEALKFIESNSDYFNKQQNQDQSYNQPSLTDNKPQSANQALQLSNNYPDNVQSPASFQRQGLQYPPNQHLADINSMFKLNDIPYRLTQGLPAETFRMYNNNYEQKVFPPLPSRLNQNVGSHQLDVSTDILNKLMLNKQPSLNYNRPEIDSQQLSNINGFKVANPYNIDLKLVSEMLKGKTVADETHLLNSREQFKQPSPLRLDFSQLQPLLSPNANLVQVNDGHGSFGSSYFDSFYNNGRFPYQGVKYSRSQEEEEPIMPIADSSNNHPIGAVVEQDDPLHGREGNADTDLITAHDDDIISGVNGFVDDLPKNSLRSGHRGGKDRQRHPNSLSAGRNKYQRKFPKTEITEPYPLLKPPPFQSSRVRGHNGNNKFEQKQSRRQRLRRPKILRILKPEPLFEADGDLKSDFDIPILMRSSSQVAEAKSDRADNKESS